MNGKDDSIGPVLATEGHGVMEYYVYAYIDPRDGTPFYIGAGKRHRDVAHLTACEGGWCKSHAFFYAKLRKLLRSGIHPIVRRLLDRLTFEESRDWECFFIGAIGRRDLGQGPLCNLTDGGDGFKNPSYETRHKLAACTTARMKARYSNPDERVRQSERIKAHFASDPEHRRRQSERMKALASDPDERKRRSEQTNAQFATPEARKRHSDRMKAYFSDPDARGRLSEQARAAAEARRNDPAKRAREITRKRYAPPRKGRRFRGVRQVGRRFRADFSTVGTQFYLGTFLTELEAAKAYNDAVDKYWNGEGYKNPIDETRVAIPTSLWDIHPPGRPKGVRRTKNTIFAEIHHDGKSIYLGSFATEVEAAEAYNDAVDKYRGGKGYKNPIDETSLQTCA